MVHRRLDSDGSSSTPSQSSRHFHHSSSSPGSNSSSTRSLKAVKSSPALRNSGQKATHARKSGPRTARSRTPCDRQMAEEEPPRLLARDPTSRMKYYEEHLSFRKRSTTSQEHVWNLAPVIAELQTNVIVRYTCFSGDR